ncbi:MAG: hypothetical protein HZB62_14820 [Nitrospirae bacterium]|nr:hypothetical protein [Nitrospirota bacterium]
MKICVNEKEIELAAGMTVRHALIHAGLLKEIEKEKKVYDQWGNELGLDGSLCEGMLILVK